MMKTVKHARSAGRFAGRLAVGGGILAAGAVVGAVVPGLLAPRDVAAGEHNYVQSFTHDAISGIRLDEEVTVRFASEVLKETVGPDTILIRTGTNSGEQARGRFVVGKFMYDKGTQRRVVIRPEAVQEYFQLVRGLSRTDATRQASNLIERIEQTGNFGLLRKVDKGLVGFFGVGSGAGSRLDDETVFGIYPPPRPAGDPLVPYRARIAGDDALWQDFLLNQNEAAYLSLRSNSEFERFFHPKDASTGIESESSVLRSRSYRKVLIDRRGASRAMFVPEIPIRADLADTGYKPGVAYSVVLPASQPGVYNTVLTKKGRRPLLQAYGRDFSTFFATIPGTVTSTDLFLDNEARIGVSSLQKPRLINLTPPNGETFVDPTTDWEDPDAVVGPNQIPVSARKTFTVRLRFAQPLDPRSVNPTNFTLTRKADPPPVGQQPQPDVPVSVGTFLNQSRLGLVEVELTPATNLQPASQYLVAVKGVVKSLGGELLNLEVTRSFIVGPGDTPIDAIRETFSNALNRANPTDPNTLDQITSALWPAPAQFDDPDQPTGRLAASFMPFVGFGLGAPSEPSDPSSPIVTDLILTAGGEVVSFPTEVTDPSASNVGDQIEYEYGAVDLAGATLRGVGRHPLVIRSQSTWNALNSAVFVDGQDGGIGRTNADTLAGDPPGGLGGSAGAGGYRGGDGGCSPLTDAAGNPDLDGAGRLQFSNAKFNGTDGFPGYQSTGPGTGGGGSGGFSGDDDHPYYDFNNNGDPTGADDHPAIPERIREAGGGGGHATAGGNGAGAGTAGTGSPGVFNQALHAGGYGGGLGGIAYGEADFSDQPLNQFGAPVLRAGAGGAGGGGGGAEDDPDTTSALDTAGPEDSGGGGGGGGGGGFQAVARNSITFQSMTVDASGGAGGATENAAASDLGQGAPGGCGAGGAILLQAYEGDISIDAGSVLDASGGDNTNSRGQITRNQAGTGSTEGRGGAGGLGYVRLEDSDGIITLPNPNSVRGILTSAQFRPTVNGDYPGRTNAPMVVNVSEAYSVWFNTQLDTPTYFAPLDLPGTPDVLEGTSFFDFDDVIGPAVGDSKVDIQCRSAPNDITNNGFPNLFQATDWFPLDQLASISGRRFIQFRVTFTLPLSYKFTDPRPYVEYLQIDVQLQ